MQHKVGLVTYEFEATPQNVSDLISEIFRSLGADAQKINTFNQNFSFEALKNLDTLVIHNTASYSGASLRSFMQDAESTCKKSFKYIILKQDEHVEPHYFDNLFLDFDVETVFTCLKSSLVPLVYPKSAASGIRFVEMFTAYVLTSFDQLTAPSLSELPRLTFRGSHQPLTLGQLGRDKSEISILINALEIRPPWIRDVSCELKDRVYGLAWQDLLLGSRAVVGTESGSNVFDLDGSLATRTKEFETEFGHLDSLPAELVMHYREKILSGYEGNVAYGTFAPRHLEAALFMRPQLLVEGSYGGIFSELSFNPFFKRDLSGFLELVDVLVDERQASAMGLEFRESVLSNGSLRVSGLLEPLAAELERVSNSIQAWFPNVDSKSALVLTPCPAVKDPRHFWWYHSLQEAGLDSKMLEFCPDYFAEEAIQRVTTSHIEPSDDFSGWSIDSHFDFNNTSHIFSILLGTRASHDEIEIVSQLIRISRRLEYSDSRFFSRLFLRQLSATYQLKIDSDWDVIVANDLQSAFVACLLWGQSEAKIVYDSQEIFTANLESSSSNVTAEDLDFWHSLEMYCRTRSSFNVTVSPGIERYFKDRYGIGSDVIPNFVSKALEEGNAHSVPAQVGSPLQFVYLGSVAMSRGLENLLENWSVPHYEASLSLYIPDSHAKRELENIARMQTEQYPNIKIQFPNPVTESEIISTLCKYDVGIIPYDYSYPYNHCSPNKLGQYVAAGLAVLTNDQPFVSETVLRHAVGRVFSWRDTGTFQKAVQQLLEDRPSTIKFQNASHHAYQHELNWENFVKQFIEKCLRASSEKAQKFFDEESLNQIQRNFDKEEHPRPPALDKFRALRPLQLFFKVLIGIPVVGIYLKGLNEKLKERRISD